MSPITEFDQKLEQIISEFALRIVAPRWAEFDIVWDAAIRVCDRYQLGTPRQLTKWNHEDASGALPVISSADSSEVDAPAQIRPPAPASPDSLGYGPASVPPSRAHPLDSSDC